MASEEAEETFDNVPLSDIIEHLRTGKRMSYTISQFLEQQAGIVDAYGKSLVRLGQAEEYKVEPYDPVSEAWNTFRDHVSSIGKQHEEFAHLLKKQLKDSLMSLKIQVKSVYRKCREEEAKLAKEVEALKSDFYKLKSKQERCMREAEHMYKQDAENSPNQKVRTKYQQVVVTAETQTEKFYDTLNTLHQKQQLYDASVGRMLRELRETEEYRVTSMKKMFENYTFLYKSLQQSMEQSIVAKFSVVEKIDPDDCVKQIIKKKQGKAGCNWQQYDQNPPYFSEFFPHIGENHEKPIVPKRSDGDMKPARDSLPLVESGAVVCRVVVKFKYDAVEAGELSLLPGQIVGVLEKDESGWWKGVVERNADGTVAEGMNLGFFPVNHVEEVSGPTSAGPSKGSPSPVKERKVRAVYSYNATEDGELSFEEGDVITVLGEDKTGWWFGTLKGKEGSFPSNYTSAVMS